MDARPRAWRGPGATVPAVRVLTIGNMYPPHHLGGYEITWHGLVDHLRARGHAVDVLTTGFRRPEVSGADPAHVHRALEWYWQDHEFPNRSIVQRGRLERRNLATLRRHLAQGQPEVVALWSMGGMSLGMLEEIGLMGLPMVAVVGDDWPVYGPIVDGWQRLIRRLGPAAPAVARLAGVHGRAHLSRVGTWLFNSDRTRDEAVQQGVPAANAAVVHPGVDTSLFTSEPAGPWRGRLLYVGRIDPRKGIETAISALQHCGNARLDVIGGGDPMHRDQLCELAKRLGVLDRVRFGERSRDRVADAYRDADVLVFPVVWEEPWGLVPLEAMACGTPVVATGTGGSAEYLEHERNCLLFAPGDAVGLSHAVERLAGDQPLRERLIRNGTVTAGRYTETGFNEAIETALAAAARSVISAPPAPRGAPSSPLAP